MEHKMKIEPTETDEQIQPVQPIIEARLKKALRYFGVGTAAGSSIAFTTIIIAQFSVFGTSLFQDIGFLFFLFIAIIGGLFFGIPFGGFGGLILGSIWNYRIAAMIGGSLPMLILAPVIFGLFSRTCVLLGGC